MLLPSLGVDTLSHSDRVGAGVWLALQMRASLVRKKDVKPESRQRLEFSLACVDDC